MLHLYYDPETCEFFRYDDKLHYTYNSHNSPYMAAKERYTTRFCNIEDAVLVLSCEKYLDTSKLKQTHPELLI